MLNEGEEKMQGMYKIGTEGNFEEEKTVNLEGRVLGQVKIFFLLFFKAGKYIRMKLCAARTLVLPSTGCEVS